MAFATQESSTPPSPGPPRCRSATTHEPSVLTSATRPCRVSTSSGEPTGLPPRSWTMRRVSRYLPCETSCSRSSDSPSAWMPCFATSEGPHTWSTHSCPCRVSSRSVPSPSPPPMEQIRSHALLIHPAACHVKVAADGTLHEPPASCIWALCHRLPRSRRGRSPTPMGRAAKNESARWCRGVAPLGSGGWHPSVASSWWRSTCAGNGLRLPRSRISPVSLPPSRSMASATAMPRRGVRQ